MLRCSSTGALFLFVIVGVPCYGSYNLVDRQALAVLLRKHGAPKFCGWSHVGNKSFQFIKKDMEKFFSQINLVYPAIVQQLVYFCFQRGCIIREDHAMNVEGERDACIAQLVYAFLWVHAASHADFENIFAERAEIADDIHVAGLAVLQGCDLVLLFLDGAELELEFGKPGFELCDLGSIGGGELFLDLSDPPLVFAFLFLDFLLFSFQSAALLGLLAHLLPDVALLFLGAFLLNVIFVFDLYSFVEVEVDLANELLHGRSNTLIAGCGNVIVFWGNGRDAGKSIVKLSVIDTIKNILQLRFQSNIHSTILVIKNYDGEDLGTFRRNIMEYGSIKVRSYEGSEGGVETLQIEVNAENYKVLLSLLKDAIIENARGYDAKDDRMSGNPNQMNIQSMYSDIDLDANGIETEFQASMEELLWFVNKHLANTGVGSFEGAEVKVIFDRDVLINETEAINNCKNSVGILSDETIVKMHPWVSDPEQELKRIKAEKEEAAADPYRAAFEANRTKLGAAGQELPVKDGGTDGKAE